jgi:tRNA(adenine34) deaminase
MSYSQTDHHFMQIALEEAQQALIHGDFPVGAVLTIDNQFVAKNRNRIFSQQRTAAHAELPLLVEHSAQIRASTKAGKQIVLYSTLAPCLMCLGTTILHNIPKIIVACPDPYGGATHLDPHLLGDWYVQNWPVIETGLYREESYALLIQFLQNGDGRWQTMLNLFEQMHQAWKTSK